MGTIISAGAGSGLDVAGLVQKLVEAEGAPKNARLDSAEAKVQAKVSALGSLRSALASFRDAVAKLKDLDAFQGRLATPSSKEFLSASATSAASPATYEIEVTRLACAHKLQSEPFVAKTSVIGTGTLTITTAGQSFDVAIDATSNTVAGVASAINASAAGAKLTATVVVGAGGAATLTLTARETGSANAITVAQAGGDGGLSQLVFPPSGGGLTEIREALDARVLIDGVEVTSATNTISGAIDGVEIDLVAANDPGETSDLAISYDRKGAREAIDSLVKSYNAVVDAIKSVASYNAETRKGGPLFGDAGVQNLVYQLRRELGAAVGAVDASFDMLAKIGVSVDVGGKLAVDGAKLDKVFAADFDEVGKLFASDNVGVATKLDKLLEPYLRSGGILDSRNDVLKASIEDITSQRDALAQRLEALQARYLKQFNALDGLLAQMQSTSNFLAQQLRNLPGTALSAKK
jgi:flagellar hook-associated protein 2